MYKSFVLGAICEIPRKKGVVRARITERKENLGDIKGDKKITKKQEKRWKKDSCKNGSARIRPGDDVLSYKYPISKSFDKYQLVAADVFVDECYTRAKSKSVKETTALVVWNKWGFPVAADAVMDGVDYDSLIVFGTPFGKASLVARSKLNTWNLTACFNLEYGPWSDYNIIDIRVKIGTLLSYLIHELGSTKSLISTGQHSKCRFSETELLTPFTITLRPKKFVW